MTEPVLSLRGITKTFSGFTALAGVDLDLMPGEVHALVGENGAGKSTLIKIMTGAYQRDGGSSTLSGEPVDFRSPLEAQAEGVVAVYQEVHLLLYRTVAENIALGREPRRWGRGRWGPIDWAAMNKTAGDVLGRLGLDIAPTDIVGDLNLPLRQMVAIARGVSLGAKVLVLDEPTSSLTEREVVILENIVKRLRAQGTAIVYISHRFDELYALCDRVTILRDGKLVGTRLLEGLERLDLVCLMLGKNRDELTKGATAFKHMPEGELAAQASLLDAKELRRGRKLEGVSLSVKKGEILGLGGLLGSGRTETARAIFGLDRLDTGEVRLEGKPLSLKSPRSAIDAGIAFLAEDRKAEGIIPELSVRENLTLVVLPKLARAGIVSRSEQTKIVDKFMKRLRVKASSPDQKIRELSGGNQQKVLLARWLCNAPRVLLLDEPTRGIDLGARAEIQALVAEMAADGLGVLLISSDLEELIEGSSRVVVLREGKSVAELRGDEITQDRIIHAMAEGGT